MNTTTTNQNANDVYDYPAAIEADIRDWLEENDGAGRPGNMHDECERDVTGQGAGSYTCNARLAAEHIRNSGFVLGDDWQAFILWLEESGYDIPLGIGDSETFDVLIRLFYFDRAWIAVTIPVWDTITEPVF